MKELQKKSFFVIGIRGLKKRRLAQMIAYLFGNQKVIAYAERN